MPNFVSISGLAGSGKTTISNYLHSYFHKEWYSCREFSFAGPLKDALCLWFDWDRKRLDTDYDYKEGNRLNDGSIDPYCAALKKTRRQIMQVFGTECMRDGMQEDFWITLAKIGIEKGKIPPSDVYLISDARMTNELVWVRSINGYEIRVDRAECAMGEDPAKAVSGATLTKSSAHASEQQFLHWKDYDEEIINLIDHNKPEIANRSALIGHLNTVTIPAIRARFGMKGKGRNNPELWR
jgi:hypothetical protein